MLSVASSIMKSMRATPSHPSVLKVSTAVVRMKSVAASGRHAGISLTVERIPCDCFTPQPVFPLLPPPRYLSA